MDLLRHLRYFVAVAEELHFGRAAKRLHMSQPPLSQRIAGLERELGVKLLTRSSRRVALTPAGETLLVEARTLLAAAGRLRATMDELRDGHAGALRAAVPPGTPAPVLAAIVEEFEARRPAVDLQLREAPTTEQIAALQAGRLDAALVRTPAPLQGLARGASFAAPLGVLVPSASPLAERAAVELADLSGQDLVTTPRADAPERHDQVLATCHALGFVPNRVHEASNAEFAFGLILAGRAVALVEPATPARAGVAWRPLAGDPLHVALTPAWSAGDARGAVDAFADAVVAALAGADGWAPQSERLAGPPVLRPAWTS